jgi:biopolymer transport protein ExbB/biopolymer transport protein TolQ
MNALILLLLQADSTEAVSAAATGHTSLAGLWSTMGWFPRAIVFILVIMIIMVIAVTIAKLWRFTQMSRSTRRFAPQFSSNLKEGKITDALKLVQQYETKSHVARVLGISLREVKPLLPLRKITGNVLDENSDEPDENITKLQLKDEPLSDDAVETAERAVEREQVLLASDMKSGLGIMATVGATAPFVGLLGTVLGVIDAFQGMSQAGGGIAAVSAGIAEALITTAVGLLVAIPSVWLYNYFNTRLNTLFSELSYAGREMVDWMMGKGTFSLEEELVTAEDFSNNEPSEVKGLNFSNEGSAEAKRVKGPKKSKK